MSSTTIVSILIVLITIPELSFCYSQTVTSNAESSALVVKSNPSSLSADSAQYQSVTYQGNLTVSSNKTFSIENAEFYLNGTIIANDTSTLLIKDSQFTVISRQATALSVVLKNQAHLIIQNSTVIFKNLENAKNTHIVIEDNASTNIRDSKIQGYLFMDTLDTARIYIRNSTITLGESSGERSRVATWKASTAEIENATLDEAAIFDNSTASIENSFIAYLDAESSVNATNSKIESVQASGGFSLFSECSITRIDAVNYAQMKLVGSHIQMISASGGSKIWLKDTSYRGIETLQNAEVSIVWHLPIIGSEVAIPYRLVTTVQLSVVLGALTAVLVVLLIWRRHRAKRSKAIKELIKHASPPPKGHTDSLE